MGTVSVAAERELARLLQELDSSEPTQHVSQSVETQVSVGPGVHYVQVTLGDVGDHYMCLDIHVVEKRLEEPSRDDLRTITVTLKEFLGIARCIRAVACDLVERGYTEPAQPRSLEVYLE